ncbi:probable aspartate aminotransferase, cytoplasmic [Phialocephala subalpina]|uniref:Aspartate aminotransferase n=1 Tax=Phialocephala subalpina TaxID=576137 RepID=A0A1L7XMM7_9HELO|nr:probable aspartate aminotransferase, cytoplasmic [Phialocephala subalpina]
MGSIPASSPFSNLSVIPLDPHYALKELFNADHDPKKVILGSGVYRDDNSKPWVLPSVKKAEELVDQAQDSARYEYLPITGYAPFYNAARDLLFGPFDEKAVHVVSLHTISGTGANHLGARFLSDALRPSSVWLSDPSWVNHANIWGLVGVTVKLYPYWNREKRVLDFEKMIEKLETEAATGDVIVLHACAHNPTGVDPTKEQWKRIAEVCEKRALFPFFDCAYQGFATGDLDEDAWAVRHFVERGTLEIAVAQSFSKNMGLYGERVGAFHLVTASPDSAAKAKGHLTRLQRGQISQPPTRGSKLATTILTNPRLFQEWLADLREMSSRIKNMRKALYEELLSLGTPGTWDHIVSQIGMFSYTGLSPEQVATVQTDNHVYILKSGRISVAGLNTKNVKHVAEGIDAAVRKWPS